MDKWTKCDNKRAAKLHCALTVSLTLAFLGRIGKKTPWYFSNVIVSQDCNTKKIMTDTFLAKDFDARTSHPSLEPFEATLRLSLNNASSRHSKTPEERFVFMWPPTSVWKNRCAYCTTLHATSTTYYNPMDLNLPLRVICEHFWHLQQIQTKMLWWVLLFKL